ncbi:GNAT family N-acetyltransferase [Catellatospora coxensis]
MVYEVRQLQEQDGPAAWRLGSVVFGYHASPAPEDFSLVPGRVTWGVLDGDRLIAKAVDREQGQWFGGRIVPTSGVAGVAVAPRRAAGEWAARCSPGCWPGPASGARRSARCSRRRRTRTAGWAGRRSAR